MAGKKRRGTSTGSLVTRDKKYVEPAPEFGITAKELPAIKDWSVGKKYTITLEVEMVSQSKGDEWDIPEGEKAPKFRARFKILKAGEKEEPNEED